MFIILLHEVGFNLFTGHVRYPFQLFINDNLPVLIKVWLIKVQWSELVRSLENVLHVIVVNLIPHHYAEEVLH
jgi:hypothetical protein